MANNHLKKKFILINLNDAKIQASLAKELENAGAKVIISQPQTGFRKRLKTPVSTISGWMSPEELSFLYHLGGQMESVIELGSWKGKSTYALCSSGCPNVIAIDHWRGSKDEGEAHAQAADGSVLAEFIRNTSKFTNLTTIVSPTDDTVNDFPDSSVDMIFLDAGHSYNEVRNDIRKWRDKAKIVICGHDYTPGWPGVQLGVQKEIGIPDEVHDTIWVKWFCQPLVSVCSLTQRKGKKLQFLKKALKTKSGYTNYEWVTGRDFSECLNKSNGEIIIILDNASIIYQGFLRKIVWDMVRKFPRLRINRKGSHLQRIFSHFGGRFYNK